MSLILKNLVALHKPDLAITEEENIFRNPGNVGYYMDENFLYYGLFRSRQDGIALVIGPVAQTAVDHALAVRILRNMGESIARAGELREYFSAMPAYPLRNFLQILCTVNYFLNGEKLDVGHLLLGEEPLPPVSIPPKKHIAEQDICFRGQLDPCNPAYSRVAVQGRPTMALSHGKAPA